MLSVLLQEMPEAMRTVADHGRMIEDAFAEAGFDLIDVLIYVRLGTGVFRSPTTQSAHGYFLVFRRPAAQLQEAAA